MKFSVTEIETYKNCRRLGNFTSFNGQGMTKLLPPNYFNDGSIWHDGHHRWLTEPNKFFVQCMLEAAKDKMDKVEQAYYERLGFHMTKDESTYLWDSMNILPQMADNYQKVWQTPLPPGYRLIAPEQTIIIDVPGSVHQLELTPDALIQHEEENYILIIERKTYKSRPRLDKLMKNNQFLRYAVGCRLAGLGNILGVAYDGAWKRAGPTKKDMSIEDMFVRTTILRTPYELEQEVQSIAYDLNQMAEDSYFLHCRAAYENEDYPAFHPQYYVSPLLGCGNCSIHELCEAYREGRDWQSIYETQYGTREKQGYALVTEADDD